MKILKPTLLGLCNLLGFSLSLHAQVQITESTPLHEQIEDALAPLDMSAVTTQILFDKGMDFYDWTKFGDSLPPDSLATTANDWGWHFAQVASSCLNEYDPLPDPDSYLNLMSNLDETSTLIQIASMLVDYHRFHPDAIGLGLLTYDSINQTFHDATGQNPYLRDTFFVATLLGKEVYAGTLDIVIPDSLQMGNLPTPDSMEIDLGNGQGWTRVRYNQAIQATFEAGEQFISLRFTLSDGSQWYAKTSLIVRPVIAESSSSNSGVYSDHPDKTIPEVEGAIFNIFYGNDCQKLLKPFIFIEGFNPSQFGNTIWEEMKDRLSATSLNGQDIITPTGNTLWQDLYNEGYDLIYVDFDDGAGDILYNVGVVEDIIEWVNAEKALNGSIEKNIVMGVSMGGLIGFRALRTMEVNDIDHQTESFISYDSPLYGANLPLGLQWMVKLLGNFHVSNGKGNINDVEPKLKIAEEVLLTPAAKQMLYYHAYTPGITEWHDNFYSALHADGPLEVRHISISNGSSIGENQVLSPGEQYMKIEGQQEENGGSLEIEHAEVYAMNPPTAAWKVLYKHKIKKKILNITVYSETWEIKNVGFTKLYDSSPGGASNLGLGNTFGEGLGAFQVNITNEGAFGFIPTVSALNIAGNPDPMTDLEGNCSGNNIYRCIASTDDSVILPYTMNGEHNQDHVSLNSKIATFLLYFFKKGSNESEINPLTDRKFNFGETDEELEIDLNVFKPYSTIDNIDFDLLVEQQGQLWVNRDDRIDFTDIQDNPLNNSSYHFDLNITENNCPAENTTVTVQSGGELIIGDWNGSSNTASVFVNEGASILIKDGGLVSIDKDSEVVIKDGGKLKVEEGGILRSILGARIIVEEGGILEIDADANIDLFWHASNIHIKEGGELIINGEFNFDGYGYFQFDEGHIFTQNAKFKLSGQSDRFIRLNSGAVLNINQHGIELENGVVEFKADAAIETAAGASVDIYNMNFEGIGISGPEGQTGLHITKPDKIVVLSSGFENLDWGLQVFNVSENTPFNIWDTDFLNNVTGIGVEQASNVFINRCDFTNTSVSDGVAVNLLDMTYASIYSSTVSGYYNTSQNAGAIMANTVEIFTIADTEVLDNYVGLTLDDVINCRISNSLIADNTVGIHIPPSLDASGNETNVFLFSQTKVNENDIGIHFEAGGGRTQFPTRAEFYGMLTLDCAELYNNGTGVLGDDVILNIDAFLNSNSTDPNEIRSNKIHGSGTYFEICYDELEDVIGDFIPARGNYWGGTTDPTNVYGDIRVQKINGAGGGCATPGHILNIDPMIATEPSGCAETHGDPEIPSPENEIKMFAFIEFPDQIFSSIPGNECSLAIGQGTIQTDSVHYDGYNLFRSGMFTEARQEFQKTAMVSSFEWAASSDLCKHYINVAKVMAPGNTQQLRLPGEEKPELEIEVIPNPAKHEFLINYESLDFDLTIYDLMGRSVHSGVYSNTANIDSHQWLSGLYFIVIRDKASDKIKRGKVMIVK